MYSEGLFGLTEAAEEATTFEDANEPSKLNGWFYINFYTCFIFLIFVLIAFTVMVIELLIPIITNLIR